MDFEPTSIPTDLGTRLTQAPVAVRAVITQGERSAHVDLGLEFTDTEPRGFGLVRFSLGVDGAARTWSPNPTTLDFPAESMWPMLAAAVPPGSPLGAAPVAGVDVAPDPIRPEDPEAYAAGCHTVATVAVMVRPGGEAEPIVRERVWLVGEGDALLAVWPDGLHPARPGAFANAFVWDLAGLLGAVAEEVA